MQIIRDRQHILHRATEPVELPHHQNVTVVRPQIVQRLRQPRPRRAARADLLLKHPHTARGAHQFCDAFWPPSGRQSAHHHCRLTTHYECERAVSDFYNDAAAEVDHWPAPAYPESEPVLTRDEGVRLSNLPWGPGSNAADLIPWLDVPSVHKPIRSAAPVGSAFSDQRHRVRGCPLDARVSGSHAPNR